ncbi:MAG: protein kinase [Polaromonas sp.]|nr:protein kinase [Gemmatimonadaceae bacterium]
MTDEGERLYERALELPPEARDTFVRAASGGQPALCEELLSLLAHADGAAHFFDELGDAVRAVLPAFESDGDPPDPMIGCFAGRFRIISLLGRGGMGIVYRAHDERLNRDVALKVLPPHAVAGPSAAERFLSEARTAGALAHPNVCTVHEIGETDDGRPYIAMTLYEGETLRERLARGPLPARDAAATARELTRALGAAHARRIVHRDVKPGNVILGHDGVARLLDFGLARFGDACITATGATPGTIAYMSPEQAAGSRLDHRSDLWSLGVVLHEMLAGARPFHAGSDRAVLAAILHGEAAPLSAAEPPVPPALQRIVARLLRKVPEERYPDAAAVEADLDAALADDAVARSPGPSRAAAPPSRSRRRLSVAGATLAGALALAAAIPLAARWHRGAGAAPAPRAARSLAVLPFVEMSGDTANRYFSDGLSEEITTTLGRIEGLRVAARSSAFALRGRDLDVRRIGETLGVDAVLEGSVRRAGSRLRVSAQLVDAKSGLQLWSDEYDRQMSDVFTVQDEIARAISDALTLRMPAGGVTARARGATDPAAYDLYLHALALRSRLRPDAMQRAADLLDRATEIQPDFALAWAAKASVIMPLVFFRQIPAERGLTEVRAATARAFALDPQIGEAHVARGMVQLFFDWDWAGAERSLRRATALNPNDPHAWHHLGNYWRAMARPDEAADARLRGLAIDPLDARLRYSLGEEYLAAGRLSEARAAFERAAQLDPLHAIALGLGPAVPHGTWSVSLAQGRDAEAVQELLRVATLRGATTAEGESLRRAFAAAGIRAFWRRWLIIDEQRGGSSIDPMRVAALSAMAGDTARALGLLEHAYAERNPALIFLRTDPAFAAIRTHPRFLRILWGMRFPAR